MIQNVHYIGEPQTMQITAISTKTQIRTRNGFDEQSLGELAESIKQVGIMSPLIVDQNGTLIAGERRLLAASMAGLTEVPVLVRDATEADAATLQAIENLQRENLSLADTAEGVAALLTHYKTPAAVCKALGKSPAWVSKHLSMTRLSATVKVLMLTGATEDMELLLCLDKIARTKGEQAAGVLADLIDGIESGTTTRAIARGAVARLKGKDQPAKDEEGESEGENGSTEGNVPSKKFGRLELALETAQLISKALKATAAPAELQAHVRDFINNVWGV